MAVTVTLFGPPAITLDGVRTEPGATVVAAAAYYLAYQGGWVSRDELLLLFWPDRDEGRARTNLRQVLRKVRSAPYAQGLEVERRRVRWSVATCREATGDASRSTPWSRGVLLDGFRLPDFPSFEGWVDAERAELTRVWRREMRSAVARAIDADDQVAALGLLDGWLDVDPLDERVVLELLELARDAGRPEEALARYRVFERLLERELGLAPTERCRAAVERLESVVPTPFARPLRDPPTPRPALAGRLPPAACLGRDAERTRIAGLLAHEGSAVVLVGMGGIGKSRLAQQLVDDTRAAGRTASFVSAEQAQRPEEVAASVADAVGDIVGAAAEPLERARAALAAAPRLVVVDNVEQIEGVEAILEALREASPQVSWLVTSRRRLALDGAVTIELGGLHDAPAEGGGTAGAELFRARSGGGAAAASSEAATRDIETLVAALGGVPLAIELAAPWARLLSVHGVLERLHRGEPLEAAPGDRRAVRHVSMAAVFDASWQMLDQRRRDGLARLSVFRGGCTVAAAAEVAELGYADLAHLRDTSWIDVTQGGRVVFHPLVEPYLRERVERERLDVADVRRRHAVAYLDFAREHERLFQAAGGRILDLVQAEHGNFEAAVTWAIAHEAWDELVGALCTVVLLSYTHLGRQGRFRELVRSALERAPRGSMAWAVLEGSDAERDHEAGRHELACERLLAATDVILAHGDPYHGGWALFSLSRSQRVVGRLAEARASLEQADALLASIDEVDVRSMVLQHLQSTTVSLAERERVFERWSKLQRNADAMTNDVGAAFERASDLALGYGRHRQALALVDRALAALRDEPWNALDLALRLGDAAYLRLLVGDVERALADASEARELGRAFMQRVYFYDHGWPVAMVAWSQWLAGDAAGAQATLASDDAVAVGHGHASRLLQVRMRLDAGDAAGARRLLDAASVGAHRVEHRSALWSWIELRTLHAEVALAEGHPARALACLAEAASLSLEHTFVPAQLTVLAVALPLLDGPERERARRVLEGHPATTYLDRRRLSQPSAHAVARGPFDPPAAWADALATLLAQLDLAAAGA